MVKCSAHHIVCYLYMDVTTVFHVSQSIYRIYRCARLRFLERSLWRNSEETSQNLVDLDKIWKHIVHLLHMKGCEIHRLFGGRLEGLGQLQIAISARSASGHLHP